ncbi:MAG: acriflavin resistance protein [Flavobacteriaceae bacterium CG18_big_fil_WC_8_21_14_2_50_34_36]|nr:MAG: acriflavin resistance protein [Flavobacteriaceae bacterium CG18_big_fil_WC_8_21_14_2_50_34_36]
MFDYFYKRPYLLYAIIFGFFVVGIIALITLPKNLFPDSTPPQVLVITKVPGATAQVAANSVSKPIEQEIARLGLLTDVSSINVANFSIVKAEFSYEKGLNAAAVDVANALSIAKGNLPADINPAVYSTGDFTLPVDVISISPKTNDVTLADIRKMVDGFIKPNLLSNPEIGNVEVFGGYESAINIEVDPFKAKQYNIDFDKIAKVLQTLNHDIPVGLIKGDDSFYTITYYGENDEIEKIKQINIIPNVTINDIANVEWGYKKRTSGYIGNAKPAIALAIQRAPGGSVLGVSNAAREELKNLQDRYPNFNFEIADTQRNLIELANDNMLVALRDAIFFTLLVILFFIGNLRAIAAAAITIPLVFFSTLAIIWLTGGSLNIVIYTAIILALGMLADDAIVVLENIERHLNELGEDLKTAVQKGTKEVVGPIWSGTMATIAIVTPLMFIGGFPEKIFKPLIFTLIISLLVSFFLSITFIPKLLEAFLKNGHSKNKFERWFENIYEKSFGRLVEPYVNVIKFSNGKRKVFRRIVLSVGVVLLLLISVKTIMPVIGKDAMPPMDTGIIKAQIGFSANETVESSEIKMAPFLLWLHQQPWVEKSSVAFGNEMGVLSLGSGNLPTEATITINCVDRFSRDLDLWQIEDLVRDKIANLEGVKRNDVFDFGATALSTIKATLNIRLKSPVVDGLAEKSQEVKEALKDIHGLTSVSTSWNNDFSEFSLNIDKNKVLSYGITPYEIISQILIKGQVVSLNANLQSLNAQPVSIYFKGKFGENEQALRLLPIKTATGDVPLAQLATITKNLTFAKIERNKMLYSVDVNGYRKDRPVTHITDDAEAALAQIKNDSDVIMTQEGDISQINDSFSRMTKAIGLGIFLLMMVLISIYRSVKMAIIMIVVLPLSMIGAAWGMLLFHKPSCMPSLLGILLLFGIIIKNSILLIDFYQQHRATGESPFDSAIESVRVRFRPVMMTAFATIAGMIPIAMEQAVGLERLSPLADVAIGGLLIGTLLTLIFVPMYAYMVDKDDTKKSENQIIKN